uniref:Putative secreted protein n=1 Tax=Anopheles darlingi TaxID=43151 RepID=A0A2M4DFK4_ANODA
MLVAQQQLRYAPPLRLPLLLLLLLLLRHDLYFTKRHRFVFHVEFNEERNVLVTRVQKVVTKSSIELEQHRPRTVNRDTTKRDRESYTWNSRVSSSSFTYICVLQAGFESSQSYLEVEEANRPYRRFA